MKGIADAQYGLGLCYGFGNGVGKDDVQAVTWWRKAALQGCMKAQGQMARAYHEGLGGAVRIETHCNPR